MFIWPRRADRNTQVINKSSEQNRWHQAADLVPMATVDGAGSWLLCCLWRVEVVRCFPLGKPPRHPAAVRENNSARVEKLLKIRRLYNNIIIQFKSQKCSITFLTLSQFETVVMTFLNPKLSHLSRETDLFRKWIEVWESFLSLDEFLYDCPVNV